MYLPSSKLSAYAGPATANAATPVNAADAAILTIVMLSPHARPFIVGAARSPRRTIGEIVGRLAAADGRCPCMCGLKSDVRHANRPFF
jgi:hypothetical protein